MLTPPVTQKQELSSVPTANDDREPELGCEERVTAAARVTALEELVVTPPAVSLEYRWALPRAFAMVSGWFAQNAVHDLVCQRVQRSRPRRSS